MPEPTTTPTVPQAAPQTPEPGTGPRVVAPAPQEPPHEPQAGNEGGQDEPRSGEAALRREAANYRTRLRDTEAERDTLRERVAGYQRAEVEGLVGDRLATPADLFLLADVSDFIGDDGQVDAERVTERIDAALKERPHWAKPAGGGLALASAGFQGGPVGGRPSIGEALKGAAGR
jgi:hypothetical protein